MPTIAELAAKALAERRAEQRQRDEEREARIASERAEKCAARLAAVKPTLDEIFPFETEWAVIDHTLPTRGRGVLRVYSKSEPDMIFEVAVDGRVYYRSRAFTSLAELGRILEQDAATTAAAARTEMSAE